MFNSEVMSGMRRPFYPLVPPRPAHKDLDDPSVAIQQPSPAQPGPALLANTFAG